MNTLVNLKWKNHTRLRKQAYRRNNYYHTWHHRAQEGEGWNQKTERRLKARAIELEAAYKELETYSYSVSHDLRTPLLGINGLSRVLIERYSNHLDAKGQQFLSIMHSSTQKMLQLIDDLLTFSRSEHQQMNIGHRHGRARKGGFEELKSIIPEQTLLLDIKTLPPARGDSQWFARSLLISCPMPSNSQDPKGPSYWN